MADTTSSTPAAQGTTEASTTSRGKVALVMHKSQGLAASVELGEYTFEKNGDPVEVPKSEAEEMLARRDENGWPYVAKA